MSALAQRVWDWITQAQRRAGRGRPLLAGLAGPQGAGKSTLTAALQAQAAERGLRLAALSLDDYYLTRRERARLAATVHPLFATRGPPGTHDVAALNAALTALAAGRPTPLWRFDKGADERCAPQDWPCAQGAWDVILLEGWCVGAAPEPLQRLAAPVNALEAQEDCAGHWRHAVNAALAGPYQQLFQRLDGFALLTAPDFATVQRWRTQQEQGLAQAQRLRPAALVRFTQHFQRVTQWMSIEAPARAALHVALDLDRRPS